MFCDLLYICIECAWIGNVDIAVHEKKKSRISARKDILLHAHQFAVSNIKQREREKKKYEKEKKNHIGCSKNRNPAKFSEIQ